MTDIHFGKKSNSETHNVDCLRYLDWFCEQVKENGSDYVAFLGDWNENRSALNIATLNHSYLGAKKLNDLGLPVFFCVGNHDLFHRHTREIYSVVPFREFKNFIVVDNPIIIKEIADGVLFSPYMFHEEYPSLLEYRRIPFWAGHFEFQGFVITGHNMKMPTGPRHHDFAGPKHIVSGHFHKRQTQDNITYIGNTFPMDFGDAGDNARGMMVYDHITDQMEFFDWVDCPQYVKIKLSSIVENEVAIPKGAHVRCLIDVPLSFEESTHLRAKFVEEKNLREFIMEESAEITGAMTDTETDVEVNEDTDLGDGGVDELVVQMLREIKSEHIDNDMLVEQYRAIQI